MDIMSSTVISASMFPSHSVVIDVSSGGVSPRFCDNIKS